MGGLLKKNTIDLVTLSKWKEKINFRNFDTSSTNWSYPWYTHQKTIEILKYSNDLRAWDIISKQEIKFILPTNN